MSSGFGLVTIRLLVLLLSAASKVQSPDLQSQSPFGGELFHYAAASASSWPGTVTLSSACSAGSTVAVLAGDDGNSYSVSGVTDTKGNSYSQIGYVKDTAYEESNLSIWTGYLITALATSDTLRISWTPEYTINQAFAISVACLNNVARTGQPDATANKNAYMRTTAVMAPGRVRANTIQIGLLFANDFRWNIGSGTIYDVQVRNIQYHFYYHVSSSAGTYDPGGTGPPFQTYNTLWISLKMNSSSAAGGHAHL